MVSKTTCDQIVDEPLQVPSFPVRSFVARITRPAMMAVYSHVPRKARDEAAKTLEPDNAPAGRPMPDPPQMSDAAMPAATNRDAGDSRVTSQRAPSRVTR